MAQFKTALAMNPDIMDRYDANRLFVNLDVIGNQNVSEQQLQNLQLDGATAKAVVDHLLLISSHKESDEWRAKYLAIQDALIGGRRKDAIRENSRLCNSRFRPKWVVSRELSNLVAKALGNVAYEMRLPNPGKTEIRLDQLPADVTERGTIADEYERHLQEICDSFKRDPIDEDPKFKDLLERVDKTVDERLVNHPMRDGFGFCRVFWGTKKQVLKDEYNIDWRTPIEMNPNVIFD